MHFFRLLGEGVGYDVMFDVTLPHVALDPCPVCQRRRHGGGRMPCNATVSQAQRKWPDVLTCVYGEMAVSDRVAADMKEAGLTGLRFHAITLEGVPSKKACPWNYWLVECLGSAELAVVLPPGTEDPTCPRCGMWSQDRLTPNEDSGRYPPLRLKSWDGKDFVRAFELETVTDLCSERVVDLARERGWTNVDFRAAGTCVRVHLGISDWRVRLDRQLALYNAGASWEEVRAAVCGKPDISSARTPGSAAAQQPLDTPAASADEVSPAAAHPFDDMVDDGYACQGLCHLDAGFGDCSLLVFPDGDDGPSDEQRELFDAFVASEARWLPLLQRKLPVALRKAVAEGRIALPEPVPPTVAGFSDLARWLEAPDVSVEAQEGKTEGLVGISYTIRGTDWTVQAHIRPDADTPGQLVRVSVHIIGECEADCELVQTGPNQHELVITPKQERDEGEEDASPGS